jgi:hypothetical protein
MIFIVLHPFRRLSPPRRNSLSRGHTISGAHRAVFSDGTTSEFLQIGKEFPAVVNVTHI